MLKASDNPAIVLPGVERLADLSGDWWVIHTKPRCEKALAWDLTARGIPYFLPLARRTQLWGGRRRVVMQPLFPSYVFFCGDRTARAEVLLTGRTVNVLPIPQRADFVREIEALHAALQGGHELNLYPFAVIGRRVRVSRGPLLGTVGTIVKRDEVTRLVLQVSVLGTAAELVIDAEFLEEFD